jgi:hypothetical protein
MNERKGRGALSSLLRSKSIIIAAVAAVAMLLGAMSVGAAVNQYQKQATLLGGFPASGNPFSKRTPTSRHTVEGVQPAVQVAAAQTASSEEPADITPPAAPLLVPVPAPILPAPKATPPLATTVSETAKPVVPPPLQQLLGGVTHNVPTSVDAGLVKITLPRISL